MLTLIAPEELEPAAAGGAFPRDIELELLQQPICFASGLRQCFQ